MHVTISDDSKNAERIFREDHRREDSDQVRLNGIRNCR